MKMKILLVSMFLLTLMGCGKKSLMDSAEETLDDSGDAITEAINDAGREIEDAID